MAPRRVLIVDSSDDTRRTLKTILEFRGWDIVEAGASRRGLDLARDARPDVIVLDLATLHGGAPERHGRDVPAWQAESTPVVFLGRLPKGDNVSEEASEHRCLATPYHYGPLIRTIEELWDRSQERAS